jgi:hypothetical protein
MGDIDLIINLKRVLMSHYLKSKLGRDLTDLDYKDAEDFAREITPNIVEQFKKYIKEVEK